MFSKWQWILSQLTRTLWVRASLYALLAILIALFAIPMQRWFGESLTNVSIGADSVGNILNILASSMLAVTTFSLSVMVTAYGSASSGATPRATQLVQQDTTTQNVLATFIGSFLFSLVGIIALSTDLYDESGRFILFLATLGVILLIVITMLRWIQHLSTFGRLEETTYRVEQAAMRAIQERIDHPCLGGKLLAEGDPIPEEAQLLYSDRTGYIEHIDIAALSRCMENFEGESGLLSPPGSFVYPAKALMWITGDASEAQQASILKAFSIGTSRSFDQDPRFGLKVLAEIASRALSPAVNDPGTAIDIISRSIRILIPWADHTKSKDDIRYPRVRVPLLQVADFFDDIFMPIARDGAAMVEVQLSLQKAFIALANVSPETFSADAQRHSEMALTFAEQKLHLAIHQDQVRDLAKQLKAT